MVQSSIAKRYVLDGFNLTDSSHYSSERDWDLIADIVLPFWLMGSLFSLHSQGGESKKKLSCLFLQELKSRHEGITFINLI